MKSPSFKRITESPFNGAPAPEALVKSPITPVDDFFVRNHGAVPAGLNSARTGDWQAVRVKGLVRIPTTLPISAVSSLPFRRSTLEATLQCAGNRRSGLQRVRAIANELPWSNEAIGNAVWEGILLSDILRHVGVLDGAAHVWLLGSDDAAGKPPGTKFGASIPLAKAQSGDVIIADKMNGEVLEPDHGSPQRAVVAGYIGARSVKWLNEIRVEREPTQNIFQAAYSVTPEASGDGRQASGTAARVLDEFPVSSAFGQPVDGGTVPRGRVTLRGWAIGGGSNIVERIEVSADGGATWIDGQFTSPAKRFVWRIWEAEVTLPAGTHNLLCRATDSGGAAQPRDPAEVWNQKGYVNNSWDSIQVHVA